MSHSHHLLDEQLPDPELERQQRRALGWMVSFLVPVAVFTLVALAMLWPRDVASHIHGDSGSVMASGVTMPKATVTQVNQTSCDGMTGSTATDTRPCAQLQVHLDEGPEAGQTKEVPLTAAIYASGVEVGTPVLLYRTPSPQDGQVSYQFADFQRGFPLLFFALLFAISVVVVARWRGFASLLGLAFAGLVIWRFMLPALVVGHDPVAVGLAASSAIMFVVLYAAHGFSTRTTTALVGTLIGLATSAALGVVATRWAHLSGVASEDDYLLAGSAPDLHLHQVVMCGVIIAGLGVLNDVTITQASAVWELAEGRRGRRDLFRGAMRIGRDHIASTVYTTAFATAGAILTTLLLLSIYQRPLLEVATGEMFAGELVRTLVGGIGLVLAVPATTAIAVAAVTAGRARPGRNELRPEARQDAAAPAAPAAAPVASQPATGRRAKRALHGDDALFKRPQGRDEM